MKKIFDKPLVQNAKISGKLKLFKLKLTYYIVCYYIESNF